MRLIIDYQKKMVSMPGNTEKVKSHQVTIRTPDKRVLMSSAFNFQEAMAGAVSIVQTEFIDVANAEGLP